MFKTALRILLIVIALALFLSIWSNWGPVPLLINTVFALLALKLMAWLGIRIEVGIWSILILLLGGMPGLLILVFLSVTGIAFRAK
ncbi:MAG: hypothetical protein V1827_01650 [Candidatus Micrarchaeota archaeon]